MQMYVAGRWQTAAAEDEITNPYTGDVVGTVPRASVEDAARAVAAAVEGAETMRRLPAYQRAAVLQRAADLLEDAADEVARTISAEEGKPLTEALGEARRTPDLIRLAASEGARMHGETIPVDAAAGNADKLGFT
ncbi:MAG: aldehyde dehydrogenase family protein, partial [Actinobacteria bacterium]|nr:aldehyde dehydrogenase family protein [Actinomycetota bacterium]